MTAPSSRPPSPPNRCCAVVDRHFALVSGEQHGVVGEPAHDAFAEHTFHGIRRRLPCLLVDEHQHFVDVPADGLLGSPSRELFGGRIESGDAAAIVRGDHAIADAGQRDGEALFGERDDRRAAPPAFVERADDDADGDEDELSEQLARVGHSERCRSALSSSTARRSP
jgi:hypothetical protein